MEYGLIWNKVIGYFLPITEIENWDLIITIPAHNKELISKCLLKGRNLKSNHILMQKL